MKICLIRNDKMGDMILTLPVVQGLREANQDYKIDIVCSKKNQKICKYYKSINKIFLLQNKFYQVLKICLLYTSPSPRDISGSRMPSSA